MPIQAKWHKVILSSCCQGEIFTCDASGALFLSAYFSYFIRKDELTLLCTFHIKIMIYIFKNVQLSSTEEDAKSVV
jgi:hypothetical protein